MTETIHNFNSYKIPSKSVLRKRKDFFGMYRKHAEPIDNWMKRVESCINCFDSPIFAEYLIIEKFMSKLKYYEVVSLKNAATTWSLKQLKEHIGKHVVRTYSPSTACNANVRKNIREKSPINAVKCEIVSKIIKNLFIVVH